MKEQEILANLHRIIATNTNFTTWTVSTPHLVALVQYAIEQEREACAQLCEQSDRFRGEYFAYKIRERADNE